MTPFPRSDGEKYASLRHAERDARIGVAAVWALVVAIGWAVFG